MTPKRYTVTAALPYTNGPVHIGHLSGVYLPADIYVRFLRSNNRDVAFICGSDEHGVPITIKAKKEGVSPQQVVDKYHKIIGDSFRDFGISFDIYHRTSSEEHHKTASDFFKKLYEEGKFVAQTTQQYYDVEANQFLADRYITGTCPRCANENAYGDQCENCGSTLNATDLINPKSALSGNVPILKETSHWYLPLEDYQTRLEDWILKGHTEWKTNVYGQCKSWLTQGLQARAVTRDLEWGVPVPVQGADGKVLYVWFDAPIGYISATKALFSEQSSVNSEQLSDDKTANSKLVTGNWKLPTGNWEDYWKSSDTKLVHFIGKDNIVFHCIIFPAMLMAHGDYILPENVPANEFLNLEGDKISTSRNWAVWLNEYLEEFKNQQDSLRYALCATAPETKDNDFTWADFQARNNNELVAILGNFVNRAMVLTHKNFEGKVPTLGELTDYDKEVLAEMATFPTRIAESIELYRFREAQAEMMNLARLGNKYLADTEPWKTIKTDEARTGTILNIGLQITANLSILCEPFLPFTAVTLCHMLNISPLKWNNAGKNILENGHLLNEASLLFAKVEDEAIAAQVQKLQDTKLATAAANATPEPIKEPISFDDFTKMDIRIGTIEAAEVVPKTKKLLKLTIALGTDTRTIVSGIAEHYSPEAIVGQQVCVLANLAPRELKGIMSQGMILMAEDATGKLCFVQPKDAMGVGSVVR